VRRDASRPGPLRLDGVGYGLQGRDLFVERITRNIFDRLSG
jgi:hypothetical protein